MPRGMVFGHRIGGTACVRVASKKRPLSSFGRALAARFVFIEDSRPGCKRLSTLRSSRGAEFLFDQRGGDVRSMQVLRGKQALLLRRSMQLSTRFARNAASIHNPSQSSTFADC